MFFTVRQGFQLVLNLLQNTRNDQVDRQSRYLKIGWSRVVPSVRDFTDPLRTSFTVVVVVFGVSLVPGLCGRWIVLLFSCNITFVLT